jgi:hypothetical protein
MNARAINYKIEVLFGKCPSALAIWYLFRIEKSYKIMCSDEQRSAAQGANADPVRPTPFCIT